MKYTPDFKTVTVFLDGNEESDFIVEIIPLENGMSVINLAEI
tara:strand:+ start:76 stop:201 length:126 start_codon:yes stop_codon:yes gene_type:complete